MGSWIGDSNRKKIPKELGLLTVEKLSYTLMAKSKGMRKENGEKKTRVPKNHISLVLGDGGSSTRPRSRAFTTGEQ